MIAEPTHVGDGIGRDCGLSSAHDLQQAAAPDLGAGSPM